MSFEGIMIVARRNFGNSQIQLEDRQTCGRIDILDETVR